MNKLTILTGALLLQMAFEESFVAFGQEVVTVGTISDAAKRTENSD